MLLIKLNHPIIQHCLPLLTAANHHQPWLSSYHEPSRNILLRAKTIYLSCANGLTETLGTLYTSPAIISVALHPHSCNTTAALPVSLQLQLVATGYHQLVLLGQRESQPPAFEALAQLPVPRPAAGKPNRTIPSTFCETHWPFFQTLSDGRSPIAGWPWVVDELRHDGWSCCWMVSGANNHQ